MADPDIRNLSSIRNNGGARNALRTSIVKALVLLINLPFTQAFPVTRRLGKRDHDDKYHAWEGPEIEFGSEEYWLNMAISAVLVIAGGIFAGLTISLMSSDEVNLQVVEQTGTEKERKDARRVLRLLKRGKHWVLVTLLLSNVITNESLPIVLDRVLGGGWPAIVSSTVAIVIFGEVIPQSISVRYGLGVGAFFAPFVLSLMYLMYPIAYPTAKLLDYLLGEDHGTFYKRAGLKTLVTLHKTMGVERLNEDEVTIISAVLDLKEKPVGAIMTPMEDVFVMSSDRILDEATIEEILHTGFNRIPIHAPGEPRNFIGMLLVRILITYDPEDALPISSFPLATLPETGPDTSCLNILNYFQEGKSHMVIISESPGEPHGALGVLTLEDVIEELIGEEIIDESDVYIDVAKSIRRVQPGPLSKRTAVNNMSSHVGSPRASFALDPALAALANESDLSKLKLGPLNKAANPRMTGVRNVHIKPGTEPHTAGTGTGDEAAKIVSSSANGVNINVHKTELGAVEEYFEQYSPRNSQSASKPLSPADLSSRGPVNGGEGRITGSPELHSYRAGGIIESIVNVDGVNKTVIEDISGSDSEVASSSKWSSSRHRSSSSNRHDDDDAPTETRPLLDI